MKRNATAIWHGTGQDGSGEITTESKVLNKTQLSYKSRFEDGIGTNPEELVAAAHAGCFTMKLSFLLAEAGFTADTLETKGYITFEDGAVTESHLVLNATIPKIAKDEFDKCVKDAELNCPMSKLLDTKITVDATLQ
ncbi:OsmC family peroxiredoxin [Flavobacterium sp. TMP13]|uniref:OsmC family peroxiredoxin n=1 Tax=unclassified Flavobacterium TaxID=196869 RepID=UPI00076D5B6D|nr:OsmC family peroxiredoxin [Flavobacterium sp. TAB 87]KVV14861.1 Peroxiredoxin OsmC [Flavobacterium sp. TAB 87]